MLKLSSHGIKEEIYKPVRILQSDAENLDKTAANNSNATFKKSVLQDQVVLDLHSRMIKY